MGKHIFHLFNSDFVDENVRPNDYNPQKDITGYILGRNQIDLTSEKYQVKELEAELLSIKADIQQRIKEALAELKRYGVSASIKDKADIPWVVTENLTDILLRF